MTKKVLTLLSLFLVAIGLTVGYLILTEKIVAGTMKIVIGQKELKEGEKILEEGKAKLKSGEQELSEGKHAYSAMKPLLGFAAVVPVTWVAFAVAGGEVVGKEITEGERMVEKGKEKVKAGEAKLEAGKLELIKGIEQLNMANVLRILCLIGAIFVWLLLIVLGFRWRQTLISLLKRTNT